MPEILDDIIKFEVEGLPAPGGSKNAFALKKGGRYTGRVALVDAGGARNKAWRSAVWAAGYALKMKPLEGPLRLDVIFRMPRPEFHYHTKKSMLGSLRAEAPIWHIKAPDTTKLLRSTEDALKGVTWIDDSQICVQHAEKIYSANNPGATITITPLLIKP